MCRWRKWCLYGCGKQVQQLEKRLSPYVCIYRCLICDKLYTYNRKRKELIDLHTTSENRVYNILDKEQIKVKVNEQ